MQKRKQIFPFFLNMFNDKPLLSACAEQFKIPKWMKVGPHAVATRRHSEF
jgi:hypothetical protein